jgi:hypothetical protein
MSEAEQSLAILLFFVVVLALESLSKTNFGTKLRGSWIPTAASAGSGLALSGIF